MVLAVLSLPVSGQDLLARQAPIDKKMAVAIINVIPDLLEFVGNIASVFNGNFSIIKVNPVSYTHLR